MLHTYCDVVEQITVRLAPYVAIATNPVRQAYVICLSLLCIIIVISVIMINTMDYYYYLYSYLQYNPLWELLTDYLNTATTLLQNPITNKGIRLYLISNSVIRYFTFNCSIQTH
jgi:hypothetical protein